MVKRVKLTSPEQEVNRAVEFILFLILFVIAMTVGILAYLDHKGLIDLHANPTIVSHQVQIPTNTDH